MNYTDRIDGYQIRDVTYIDMPPKNVPIEYDIVKWAKLDKPYEAFSLDTKDRMADLQKTIDRCKKSISDGEPIYDYKFYYDVIELLAEKKRIEPYVTGNKEGQSRMSKTDQAINNLNTAKLILCNPKMLTSEMCIRIGQAINSAINLLTEQKFENRR